MACPCLRRCSVNYLLYYCMLQNIRPDYLFSYWVFTWYIFYMLGIVTHNPKFAIIVALLENLSILGSMIYLRVNPKKIGYFIIMILVAKVIPLWTVLNTQIKMRDLYATFGLFLMYIGWIIWDEKTSHLFSAYTEMLTNQIQTPGMVLLDKLFR